MKRKRPRVDTPCVAVPDVRCADDNDTIEEIREQLRIVQNKTGCATSLLNLVLEKLGPYLKGVDASVKIQMCRVRARQLTAIKKQLHGCVGCNDHVFAPSCAAKQCPKCGHPRYDEKGNAHEVVASAFCFISFAFCVVCSYIYTKGNDLIGCFKRFLFYFMRFACILCCILLYIYYIYNAHP